MFWNSVQLVKAAIRHNLTMHTRPLGLIPELAGVRMNLPSLHGDLQPQEHIWFAVPKSKISRSRKRMKTTKQKRIPLKKNIVFDPRTGEVTLKHKLPFNWKDYLPKVD